jgi:hypothetical protein
MTPEAMAALASEIDLIRLSLVLLLEFNDQKFLAYTTAQKALDRATTALSDFRMDANQMLVMRFAYDCLIRAHAALQGSGEDEPALAKIEACIGQLAEETR